MQAFATDSDICLRMCENVDYHRMQTPIVKHVTDHWKFAYTGSAESRCKLNVAKL